MMPELSDLLVETPVSRLRIRYRGAEHLVLLKDESANPSGSVKHRTAIGLLNSLHDQSPLVPGSIVIESTSGNLGIALARLVPLISCDLIAVVDPNTPEPMIRQLRQAGASLIVAERADRSGGHVLSRLRTVRRMVACDSRLRWPNQYRNPANPLIHARTTGPEALRQGGTALDAIFAAVSTGGTMAGLVRHVRSCGRQVRMVAVAATLPSHRAAATGVQPDGIMTGIAIAGQRGFLAGDPPDEQVAMPAVAGIAVCRILRADTGIGVGGSSGCVLAACLRQLAGSRPPHLPLCLSADDATAYEGTLYDDRRLAQAGLLAAVQDAVTTLRGAGLSITAEGCGRPPDQPSACGSRRASSHETGGGS
jgi:N-(2-amino-2-carboxyethyl)-L-glutamate synthase